MSGILQQRYSFIGDVKENNRRPKDAAGSNDLHIQDVCDAHQNEDQHLSADTLKANLARQALVCNGAHHACEVVHHYKSKQGIEQAVTAAKEIPKPPSDARKNKLNRVPEFFHVKFLSFSNFLYCHADYLHGCRSIRQIEMQVFLHGSLPAQKKRLPAMDSRLIPMCYLYKFLCLCLLHLCPESPCYFRPLE